MQHHRPLHNPSRNLSLAETELLHDILGKDCITLATAVAQIFFAENRTWQKKACGVLCYVKNYQRRLYLLCLYNLKSREMILEEIISISMMLERIADRFYSFNGTTCRIGISFADAIEAKIFSTDFYKKQVDRQVKRDNMTLNNQPASPTINQNQIPSNHFTGNSNSTTRFKKSKNANNAKKKVKHHPLISGPILESFQCIIHVAENEKSLADPTKQSLLDEVLARMKISPEEAQYVRSAVSGATNGLDRNLTKSTPHTEIQKPIIPNSPSGALHIQNTRKRIPYQDISLPSANFQQKTPIPSTVLNNHEKFKQPAVLPKPISPLSNNIVSHGKTTRAPPPPILSKPGHVNIPSPPPLPPKPGHVNTSSPPPLLPKPGHVNIPVPMSPPPTPTDSENLCASPSKPAPPPTQPRRFPPGSRSPNVPSSPSSPPIPANLQNGHVAPPRFPPPLPSDLLASKENLNSPLSVTTPTSPERHFLFNQICDFDLQQLKPVTDRSTPTVKPTENETNLDEHRTLEENIRLILEKRRLDIMGCVNDQENTTDTDDDEWDV